MDNFSTIDLAALCDELDFVQDVEALMASSTMGDAFVAGEDGPPANHERPGAGVNRAFCVIA
ncbi:pheromone Phb2.1 B43 [Coprinopsis cinerea okayama7|uniref:Pheromone Phb2.1 B43 n=2 Tax=Coprinopsis cinerea TaxID=5346 RepID=A8NKB2_COPC7|nr:pheromone Phb2.1 B43 [Coprinopsis cinerea okayama7\|eukprot:XP_001834399.1 pheromone Phb2.1 B43 [Coprinopsis cinerea okayama7\